MHKKQQRAQQWQQMQNNQPQQTDHTREHDVHTYLSWDAPGRPFRERSKEYFINAFCIMICVEIILYLFSQFFLMTVVFALVFLAFALASVPPRTFSYKISSEGILIEDHFFIWEELYDFYFMKRHGQEVLHIRTKDYFPGELTLTLGTITPQQIKSILLRYLPFREYVEPTFIQKSGDWLEKNFPLEKNAR